MSNFARAIVFSSILMSPTMAHAQRIAPAGVVRAEQIADGNTVRRQGQYHFAARTLTAALGGTAGAFGVGFLAATTLSTDCSCDDPGLEAFIIGFAVGAVAGAGIGAALPRFGNDRCSFSTRLWRALGGAAAGSVAGALLGNMVSETGLLVGGSIGTAIGGPVALIGC